MSERRVGQYCAEGRIAGVQKIGRSWAIPADAEKPADPRRARSKAQRAFSVPAEQAAANDADADAAAGAVTNADAAAGAGAGCLMPQACAGAVDSRQVRDKASGVPPASSAHHTALGAANCSARAAHAPAAGAAADIVGFVDVAPDGATSGAIAGVGRIASPVDAAEIAFNASNFMPLMNTAFKPGRCRVAVDAMAPGPQHDIALAEYYYFSGQPELAAAQAQRYLSASDAATRLSACLIYAYACLPMAQIVQARRALDGLNASFASGPVENPQLKAASAFVASAGAVLLHLPLPEQMPAADSFVPVLSPGLRAFALYVKAHYLYLEGEYARSAGIAEAALAMGAAGYPIPAIYLHLVSVMDYMSLKRPDRAQAQLLAAWDLARPDDLIEGFGEHHGLLGAMLEAVIKPQWPDDFRRIIDITYRFSSGWRRVHNPATGEDVADDLTTTEFSIAMLAARDWTTAQIATHMGISPNTVKAHISEAMRKLNVASRKDLKRYMLR